MQKPSLYMKALPEQIADYVIFSGDPFRVEVLKEVLTDVEHIAFAREFNTYTGNYNDLRITVTSTGIGAPSAAIAMEEMKQCGMKYAIRMGTSMGLRDDLLGKYIIPLGSMREESTSRTYAPLSYPAVADFDMVMSMNQAVLNAGKQYDNGISCTMDGFYSCMRENTAAQILELDVKQTFERLKRFNVSGIDMESSCMLTLGRLLGVPTCIVTLCTVLENLKAQLEGEERKSAEKQLCEVVLEGIAIFNKDRE